MRSLLACLLLALSVAAATRDGGLRAGPMLAYTDLREAAIWVQTTGEATAELRYAPEGAPARSRRTPAVRTSAEREFVAVFTLGGLEPGTRYTYELFIEGRPVPRPYPLAFRTQPLWQWRTEPPDFSAMFGSCLYVNETPYDRPGKPYGGDYEILSAMADKRADLMLWLGDNVYTREVDFGTPGGIRRRYWHDRALPELQRLLAVISHYATWDDHDFGPDNSDGSYALKDESLEAFRLYWPAIHYGAPGIPGVFQKVSWADVDFFLLDDRYHRKPDDWPDGPDRRMLGRPQLEWLLESLVSSRATFKIVALGNQVLNPVNRTEALSRYPVELEELLGFIRDQRIGGVLFLSGDLHFSELIRVQPPGLYPLYDFTSSPLTAGVYALRPDDPLSTNPHRVAGTLLTERSFGLLRFQGPRAERRVTLGAYDKTGALKWEHTINRSELSFPR